MSSIKEGEYYINTRKSQETHLKKDLDIIEGFHVASRKKQINFPDNFKIPSGSDPGQTVMCKRKEGKYVKIEVNSTYLNIAELQVFDENGKNVAKTGNYNYSDHRIWIDCVYQGCWDYRKIRNLINQKLF